MADDTGSVRPERTVQYPDGGPVVAAGAVELFNNARDQRWLHRPHTILVDSRQLESGEGMSDDFKRLARHQVEEFKAEYRRAGLGTRLVHTVEDRLKQLGVPYVCLQVMEGRQHLLGTVQMEASLR